MDALLRAIRRSNIDAVHELLAAGADPNALDGAGHAALCEAASRNQLETARLLLRHGAAVNIRQPDGRRPLPEAAFRGFVEMTRLLLDHGTEINAPGSADGSALYWAVCADALEAVRELLAAGCDVNQPTAEGDTPLHRVAASNRPRAWDIAQALLRHGANINQATPHGVTALMRSASSGRIEIARLLLQSGADPHAMTARRETAMICACRAYAEDAEMALLLIEYGAEPDVVDQHGLGALRLAASSGNTATLSALLTAGLRVDGYPDEPATPLQMASRAGQTEAVRILIAHGAAIDGKGNGGLETPLLECLLHHYDEIARLLLAAGADVNQAGMDGATPLLYALGCFDDLVYDRSAPPKINRSLIQLLLEMGADPAMPPAFKPTALDLARRSRNTRLIGLIKKHLPTPPR